MELFLNILWVVIALALLSTWRTLWVHQRRPGSRHSVREWTAISVALVLLFFAVSLTDDLHSDLVIMEECAASRRNLDSSISSHHSPSQKSLSHATDPAVVGRVFHGASLGVIQNVEPVAEFRASFFQADRPSGRAPPVSVL